MKSKSVFRIENFDALQVLVEHGNVHGYSAIMEARENLLKVRTLKWIHQKDSIVFDLS